jgi:hypothetical protein
MNCRLKHIIKGKIKGRIEEAEDEEEDVRSQWITLRKTGYWKLKEEALDCPLWTTRIGRGYGPVVRQTTERIDVNQV